MESKHIDRQLIYSGKKIKLELHHLEDSNTGTRHVREVVVHPGAVCVLPFLDDDRVILIRNRRYAVGQILLEIPAGTLEKNEDPINCAGRELLEETGYLAGRLKPVNHFFASPGILTERLYAYAAYDLERGRAAPEEDEEITLLPAAWDDVMEMLRMNEIQDGKTIATLLTYHRFLRQR